MQGLTEGQVDPAVRTHPAVANKVQPEDMPIHRWYRFVLSYPPHLVRHYLSRFGAGEGAVVLDPFCGTGTTIVECRKQGVSAVGIEALPMAHLASTVKTDWRPDSDGLLLHAQAITDRAQRALESDGVPDEPFFAVASRRSSLRTLSQESEKLLLKGSISPLPLHKALVLLAEIERDGHKRYLDHERLALARALVESIGNLCFGPEVGVGRRKEDTPVVAAWMDCVRQMADDLRGAAPESPVPTVHHADAREGLSRLAPDSVDAVITSPPYPNEKDYTRTTRLESVLLGLVRDRRELRRSKEALVRSNTRGVYQADEDDQYVADNLEVQRIADEIEKRRVAMGKTSGFERQYHRVTKLYFGGMARHLDQLRACLKPGARLAYVVGDQASYLRVMIRTGAILAQIAEKLGYEVTDIDLFRTRLATATGEQLREEVLLLRYPG